MHRDGRGFTIARFLDGYHDLDAYRSGRPTSCRGSTTIGSGGSRQNKWVLVTGEHGIRRRDMEQAAAMLGGLGIPHSLHVWGHGSEHDWPEWRKMATP